MENDQVVKRPNTWVIDIFGSRIGYKERIYKSYIAPHPKTKHEKFPKYYGGREVISERLAKASFSAKMLVSIDSTGLSFGVLQNIPIIMIYSDDFKINLQAKNKIEEHMYTVKLMCLELT